MHLRITILQVECGQLCWALKLGGTVLFENNGHWSGLGDNLQHITSGQAGVWSVNRNNTISYRMGVDFNGYGNYWKEVPGLLKQIDSGPFGIVYGVNQSNEIFCVNGITKISPRGKGLSHVGGYKFKHVSCGLYGCWAIKLDNSLSFRTGVTAINCVGRSWLHVHGYFLQLDSGSTGSVYAISTELELYTRLGICAAKPTGEKWMKVTEGRFTHVSVGDVKLMALAENGTTYVVFE